MLAQAVKRLYPDVKFAIVALFHIGDGLFPGQLKTGAGAGFRSDLGHFLFDGGKILRGEGEAFRGIEVVIEAVSMAGPMANFTSGYSRFNRLGQHVGSGMAESPAAVSSAKVRSLRLWSPWMGAKASIRWPRR